jgi:hypothetical protein
MLFDPCHIDEFGLDIVRCSIQLGFNLLYLLIADVGNEDLAQAQPFFVDDFLYALFD